MVMTNRTPKQAISIKAAKHHSVIDLAAETERAKSIAFNYLLRRFRMTHEDAEDVIQDACLSLLKTSKPFEGRSKFTSYFVAIVINAALMQKRATNSPLHTRSVPIDFALQVPSTHNPLHELETKKRREWILRKLSTLRPIFREAILMYYVKEKTVGETGKPLGISRSAVKARLKRGRAQMRSTTPLSRDAVC